MHAMISISGAAIFVAACFFAIHSKRGGSRNLWLVPAIASAAFFVFSAIVISIEGPTGFWPEHIRNFWGNQIWFDLLSAAAVGWCALTPRAKLLGMNLYLWLFLVASSGSIGLLAMYSRILYLEANKK